MDNKLKKYLDNSSLEALESSEGTLYLLFRPTLVSAHLQTISDLKETLNKQVTLLEEKQVELDSLNSVKGVKKLFNIANLSKRKKELIVEIEKLRREIDGLNSNINLFQVEADAIQSSINLFIAQLAREGIQPEEVVLAYAEEKDIFEKKARGEYVEPVVEQPVETAIMTSEEAKIQGEEVKTQSEQPAEKVEQPAKKAVRPEQNKKIQRLTPLQKFERRLAKTAQINAESNSTPNGPANE